MSAPGGRQDGNRDPGTLPAGLQQRRRVALDGKTYIELKDTHIAGTGAVGLWTKADSVTSFDDFSYGSLK